VNPLAVTLARHGRPSGSVPPASISRSLPAFSAVAQQLHSASSWCTPVHGAGGRSTRSRSGTSSWSGSA